MKNIVSFIIYVCAVVIFLLMTFGTYEMTLARLGYLVLAILVIVNSKK